MGHRLGTYLGQCGFAVSKEVTLYDRELSFSGPAEADVLEAWRARLDRLRRLGKRAGTELERLREELLACLARPDHRSTAKVYCCIATARGA